MRDIYDVWGEQAKEMIDQILSANHYPMIKSTPELENMLGYIVPRLIELVREYRMNEACEALEALKYLEKIRRNENT